MIRKAFIMQVNPDAHEEYQRRHNPIWPELEAVLKSHGAHNYAIYLDKARNLLFAMVENPVLHGAAFALCFSL